MTIKELPPMMEKLKGLNDMVTEQTIAEMLAESYPDTGLEIDFESFLRVVLSSKS